MQRAEPERVQGTLDLLGGQAKQVVRGERRRRMRERLDAGDRARTDDVAVALAPRIDEPPQCDHAIPVQLLRDLVERVEQEQARPARGDALQGHALARRRRRIDDQLHQIANVVDLHQLRQVDVDRNRRRRVLPRAFRGGRRDLQQGRGLAGAALADDQDARPVPARELLEVVHLLQRHGRGLGVL
ncbi:MAG TPA: hypothetical protein VF516_35795, partial [Kofleriaceae bacterium]